MATLDGLEQLLEHDAAVKIAGIDVDGILRGKLVSKAKFLSAARSGGTGFCSVIFGWDMHDQTYAPELAISNAANGYRDVVAAPDLDSLRRVPWEHGRPLVLVRFLDPERGGAPLSACPRSLLRTAAAALADGGVAALAGAEYEFHNYRAPGGEASDMSHFLQHQSPHAVRPLTEGMFGYSLSRPVLHQDYYDAVFDTCAQLGCPLEGWHTESGPGVYEAALEKAEATHMADRAALFKLAVKAVSSRFAITPCFMAKPRAALPGNSGHMHVSLVSAATQANLLAREAEDGEAPWPELAWVSDLGRHFLAGVLDGLPDVLPLLAPTINSYKRLVENFWAPVAVSWGLDHRAAAVRVLAPPTSAATATRFEVRVAGADANPHLVLAAILALGWRGVHKKLAVTVPPVRQTGASGGERLARSLKEATERFVRPGSVAREVFGDAFVDHYGGTRRHEVRVWDEAVTDWELRRYMETA